MGIRKIETEDGFTFDLGKGMSFDDAKDFMARSLEEDLFDNFDDAKKQQVSLLVGMGSSPQGVLAPTDNKEQAAMFDKKNMVYDKLYQTFWKDIDDSDSTAIDPTNILSEKGNKSFPLSQLLQHEKLYRSIPYYKDLQVTFVDGELLKDRKNVIAVALTDSKLGSTGRKMKGPKHLRDITGGEGRHILISKDRFKAKGVSSDNLKETLIHELQHHLQFDTAPAAMWDKDMEMVSNLSKRNKTLRLRDVERQSHMVDSLRNMTGSERRQHLINFYGIE